MPDPRLLTLPPTPRLLQGLRSCRWLAEGPIGIARAPGRLDVMGGIADYSGSLVCQLPLNVAASAAVQERQDGMIVCISAQELAVASIRAPDLIGCHAAAVGDLMREESRWALYPLGCVWWLMQHLATSDGQVVAKLAKGVTIILDSDIPLGGGVSSSAAIEVASMSALCGLTNFTLDPLALAVACQQVENLIVGAPCGLMDQVASCMGVEGSLLRILCQRPADRPTASAAQVLGPLAIPPGFTFVGLHSGVRHEVRGDPYTDTRIAAFMGQRIISTMESLDPTGGHLANLDATRFAESIEPGLPCVMTGHEFLARYEHTNDPVTKVEPDRAYHIAAATSHHVHEPQRVRLFVDAIQRMNDAAQRINDSGRIVADAQVDLDADAVAAGEFMYASHRSYGQCAKLGHPLTDRIVALVSELGPGAGFFGAKITGGGGGGTVAIFMRNGEAQFAALEEIRRTYSRETGRETILFSGSSPGAAQLGTTTINI